MKKFLIVGLVAFGLNVNGQITLEHAYDTASTNGWNDGNGNVYPCQLMLVKFEVSGERYLKVNRVAKAIQLYDLNHALVKTISYASFPQAPNNGYPTILYPSEKLFDNDPGIEFMYIYFIGASNPVYYTAIYNEDGTLLFLENSVGPWVSLNIHQLMYPIYNTDQGTKMLLSHSSNGKAFVYSLPGTLTLGIQEGNQSLLNASMISNPYPNPTNSSTRIDYTFPSGVNQGEIVFYDLQGKEVKRYKVDKTFDHLLISTADIQAGTYFYQLQAGSEASQGRKMVVIK